MRIAVFLAAAMLAGCATPESVQRDLAGASDFNVCRASMRDHGTYQGRYGTAEAYRRGLDCSKYASAIVQQEASRDAAAAALGAALLRPAPAPQFPRTTQCRTVRTGDVYNTYCD